MKVLHVYKTCYPETKGGLEQAIRFICKGCIIHGVKSTILTLGNENKEYVFEGTKIIVVKKTFEISSNGFSIHLFKKFKELSNKNDIIHYHYPWPSADLLDLTSPEKKTIITYHSDIIKQKLLRKIYWPLEQKFLSNADAIVATSPQYAESSHNLLKYKEKTKVIPLSVERINLLDKNTQWVESDRLSHLGYQYFLFLGVLRYYKGLNYLIDAAKKNNLPVVIAGSGPLEEELKKKVLEESITNITFTGFIDENEKLKLIGNCKAFIFPSHIRSEAFGVSMLEAQAMGKPIISCEIGTGTSYVNIDKKTGIVIKPGCSDSLSESMIYLNSNNKTAELFGKNGNSRLIEKFTIEKQAESYYQLYVSVIKDDLL